MSVTPAIYAYCTPFEPKNKLYLSKPCKAIDTLTKLKSIAVAIAACFIAFGAHAQVGLITLPKAGSAGKVTVIPEQFKTIYDGYRGWKTEYPQIDYSNSISNWAYKTKRDFSAVIIGAARNWLFMQTEERFTTLVNANTSDIKAIFGDIYLASGVHIVFSTP